VTAAVLIVNWNSGGLLAESLASVFRQSRAPDHVIVVDNASSDDSLARAARWLTDAEVICLDANVGFARANNIAARAARRYDALALLNPDAIADSQWLAALLDAAERYPRAASFASQLRFLADPGRLDGAGDAYHVSGRAWRRGHRTPCADWPAADAEVFAACAAAALYRRDAFDEVSGFDEQFFCYFEDIDLGFRLRLRGYDCIYVHRSIVKHVSSGISGYGSEFAIYHGERNLVWTFVKNMPSPLVWLYLPQHILMNLVALAYSPLRGHGRTVYRAKLDAVRGLGSALAQRRHIQRGRTVKAARLRDRLEVGLFRLYLHASAMRRARAGGPTSSNVRPS
jgi:GT2 family glycosyltransferase